MIQTSARLLQLLSLLQVRREWTGPALAHRMGVTERTVRRDIDKLRNLGYPIHASPGIAGGYQLGAGAQLPPLLLDDNEALAVALGLNSVAAGPVAGIGEASVRALAKVEQVLPSRLRPKFAMLKAAVTTLPSNAASVDPQQLTVVSAAISDRRQISFDYVKSDGDASRRLVEPYRLVDTGRRWYLVAWDVEREDWRTFRADRFASLPTERKKYAPSIAGGGPGGLRPAIHYPLPLQVRRRCAPPRTARRGRRRRQFPVRDTDGRRSGSNDPAVRMGQPCGAGSLPRCPGPGLRDSRAGGIPVICTAPLAPAQCRRRA